MNIHSGSRPDRNRTTRKETVIGTPDTSTDTDPLIQTRIIGENSDFPDWLDRPALARFFHETLKPYEDSVPDIERALAYAFDEGAGKGGFVVLAYRENEPVGAVLILHSGMKGYIPPNVLVFVSVSPAARGQGLGQRIIREALDKADGDVKLHVEYDNPAKRLYERIGFTTNYAEMRFEKGKTS